MMSRTRCPHSASKGFTLIELLVAIFVTLLVLAAVFSLFTGSQDSFRRETEVAEMQMSVRAGLTRMTRDLTMAAYRSPPRSAVLWNDGGGINPDEITVIYADPDVPLSRPIPCGSAAGPGGGPCGTILQSSTLFLDPESLDPRPPLPETSYAPGWVLTALETGDCNQDGQIGFYPFEVTQPPLMTRAGGSDVLQLNHNPGSASSDLNLPGGFNRELREDCTLVGRFRIVSYRVSPPPPVGNPTLERRDLSTGEDWVAVAHNIENLQVQYAVGDSDVFMDEPPVPNDDPLTWVNRVDVTITGRTESTNLKGASQGVFDAADTHVRRTVSSTVSLRNVVLAAENQPLESPNPPSTTP